MKQLTVALTALGVAAIVITAYNVNYTERVGGSSKAVAIAVHDHQQAELSILEEEPNGGKPRLRLHAQSSADALATRPPPSPPLPSPVPPGPLDTKRLGHPAKQQQQQLTPQPSGINFTVAWEPAKRSPSSADADKAKPPPPPWEKAAAEAARRIRAAESVVSADVERKALSAARLRRAQIRRATLKRAVDAHDHTKLYATGPCTRTVIATVLVVLPDSRVLLCFFCYYGGSHFCSYICNIKMYVDNGGGQCYIIPFQSSSSQCDAIVLTC